MKVRCKKDLSIAGGLRVFNLGDDYHYHLLSAVSDIRNEEEGYFLKIGYLISIRLLTQFI